MYVVSVFEHSLKLELALATLEEARVTASDILAIPLRKPCPNRSLPVDPYNTDGFNLFPVACVATVSMLLGTIYGFLLYWGPILWGMIGLVAGIALGIVVERFAKKTRAIRKHRIHHADVVLLVNCNGDEAKQERVARILADHHAIGVTKL
ncbi:hypothetical protein FE782_14710 [Paenibacillus antri]|uniref:Uncharacterized protein n=1 Tax=Paenibacillus antri TaxID=2582848 RepID=A0A5R9GIJ9_9BACL|nr:hypothetical protein [Paenibacillus antri]TLS51365.1 hypothetical protein FE782_14710 [Paenibacillus antri]